jgi:hypothetical protein
MYEGQPSTIRNISLHGLGRHVRVASTGVQIFSCLWLRHQVNVVSPQSAEVRSNFPT